MTASDLAARAGVSRPLEQHTSTYGNIGCDSAQLGASMDCLLRDSGEGTARNIARLCLQKNGLAAPD